MKLITELSEEVQYITEDVGGVKKYYITGPFAQAKVPNRNNRYYPEEIMEHAVNEYNNIYVSNKRAMGELGHPDGPKINLDRVSHITESLKFDGNTVMGRAKIIVENPFGKIAKNLLDEGVKLGVSTRGLGSLKSNREGLDEVQRDFRMRAIDIVADPSAPSAFVNGIMEGVEYYVDDNGKLHEQTIAEIKRRKLTEERALAIFSNFLTELAKK